MSDSGHAPDERVTVNGVDIGSIEELLAKADVPGSGVWTAPTREETDEWFNDGLKLLESLTGQDLSEHRIEPDAV